MSSLSSSGIGTLPPAQTAEFVAEMLGELAELSQRAGLEQSSGLIAATIPVLLLENQQDQSKLSR